MQIANAIGKKKTSAGEIANKLNIYQPSVSMALGNLFKHGIVKREQCLCGKGFVYWK